MTKLYDITKAHLSNEQKAQREEAKETLFSHQQLQSAPPDWLDSSGKAEWQRIVPLMMEEMPLSELDYGLLVSYCVAYSRLERAEKDITSNGNFIEYTNGNGLPTRKENPSLKISSQAMKDLKSISTSLGITLEARQRLALNKAKGKEKPVDPFEKLISK